MAIGAFLYILEYAAYSSAFAATRTWPLWVWAGTAILLPLSVVISDRHATARLLILQGCLLAAPIPFYHSVEDFGLLHSRTRSIEEWDVYGGARYFQAAVGRAIDAREPVKFWYDGGGDHIYLNGIQSMYLWGFSRLAPYLGSTTSFCGRRRRFGLVLLGLNQPS